MRFLREGRVGIVDCGNAGSVWAGMERVLGIRGFDFGLFGHELRIAFMKGCALEIKVIRFDFRFMNDCVIRHNMKYPACFGPPNADSTPKGI